MKIKEAIYEDCKCCGMRKHPPIQKEEFGCDFCKISMSKYYERQKLQNQYHEYLDITIFYDQAGESNTERKEFCSWDCCLNFLKTTKNMKFDFISLPYLTSKQGRKGLRNIDFFKKII